MTIQQVASTASAISDAAIQELSARLRGPLLRPDDDGYDAARCIWNAMIDKRPACIARCSGVSDVIETLEFVRKHDVPLAVRGGGHNIAGTALCDDGVVIDLSALKGIWVDPESRTARAQPGVTWGELDTETQVFGYAVPSGIVSTTG